jgi:hypothetical protein
MSVKNTKLDKHYQLAQKEMEDAKAIVASKKEEI